MTQEERRAYAAAYQRTPAGKRTKQRSYIKHADKWRDYARQRYYAKKAAMLSVSD